MSTWKPFIRISKIFLSYSRLFRITNIIIIILTQFLVRIGIINPFLYGGNEGMMSSRIDFSLLVLVTVLITLGGYVINDYFDYRIDRVNRPDKIVIDRMISARQSIILHLVLTSIAIITGFYLAYRLRVISFGFLFPCIAFLLWLYSAKYKRSLILGNIIVAVLSSMVLFIVWLFEFFYLSSNPVQFSEVLGNLGPTNKLILIYGFFAFLTSFFREIIKDIEDIEGDREFFCRTLPIVAGVRVSKWIIATLVLLTILILAFVQLTFYNRELMIVFWYLILLTQIPLVYLLIRVFGAQTKREFHSLSQIAKFIMFTGLLSMQLISIS